MISNNFKNSHATGNLKKVNTIVAYANHQISISSNILSHKGNLAVKIFWLYNSAAGSVFAFLISQSCTVEVFLIISLVLTFVGFLTAKYVLILLIERATEKIKLLYFEKCLEIFGVPVWKYASRHSSLTIFLYEMHLITILVSCSVPIYLLNIFGIAHLEKIAGSNMDMIISLSNHCKFNIGSVRIDGFSIFVSTTMGALLWIYFFIKRRTYHQAKKRLLGEFEKNVEDITKSPIYKLTENDH